MPATSGSGLTGEHVNAAAVTAVTAQSGKSLERMEEGVDDDDVLDDLLLGTVLVGMVVVAVMMALLVVA
jgi:hypothetical protein